MVKKCD